MEGPVSGSATVPKSMVRIDGVYRFTADQFQRMADAGIWADEDRVELLDGLVFTKMTKNPPHNFASGQAHEALLRAMPAGWCVEKETPARLSRSWEPEPDCMVLRGSRDDYRGRLAGPQDVVLIVEVSDESSRARDRGRKLRGYARAGIPVYWIIDLVARLIEVYGEPTGPAAQPLYRRLTIYRPDDAVPVIIAGHEVARFAVRDLLP